MIWLRSGCLQHARSVLSPQNHDYTLSSTSYLAIGCISCHHFKVLSLSLNLQFHIPKTHSVLSLDPIAWIRLLLVKTCVAKKTFWGMGRAGDDIWGRAPQDKLQQGYNMVQGEYSVPDGFTHKRTYHCKGGCASFDLLANDTRHSPLGGIIPFFKTCHQELMTRKQLDLLTAGLAVHTDYT